jgi:hypothetical protein
MSFPIRRNVILKLILNIQKKNMIVFNLSMDSAGYGQRDAQYVGRRNYLNRIVLKYNG